MTVLLQEERIISYSSWPVARSSLARSGWATTLVGRGSFQLMYRAKGRSKWHESSRRLGWQSTNPFCNPSHDGSSGCTCVSLHRYGAIDASFARMSEYTERLSRDYVHSACNGVTSISGDDYVIIECPFRRVTHTYCATCNQTVPLDEVKWVDSGQRISDYRKEIAASVTFWKKLRLTVLGTAYEGALQLHLDAKGNPKPGATPICARPEVVSKSRPSEDHVAVVQATQELTSALLEMLPSHFARILCEVRAATGDEGKPFTYTITNPDRPSEVLKELSARVDQAISRLAQVMNPRPVGGFTVNMERKSDGKWRNLIELSES